MTRAPGAYTLARVESEHVAAPQPEVAVGEREERSGLREYIQVHPRLAERPRLDGERGVSDHDVPMRSVGGEVGIMVPSTLHSHLVKI